MLRTLHQPAAPWPARSPWFLATSSSSSSSSNGVGGCCFSRIDRLLLRSSFLSSTEALSMALSPSTASRPLPCPSKPVAVRASLTEFPVLWALRTCVFYALLQVGLAGPPPSSILQDDSSHTPTWLRNVFGKDEEAERAKSLKKVRSKWQTTVKGTLKRRYRVPTKAEGRRLLTRISSLLSDDDSFRDATSHKGCQIRRENAHAETVCCYNVRAMFDELPTPHLVIEITAFPSGPITNADYEKAEKIENLLRTGTSI